MFVVIGTTTVDLIISGIDHMPRVDGDEFTTSSLAFCSQPLTMTLGGNGANSAWVLATLGAPVSLGSAAGQDLMGETVASWLNSRRIDLRGFQRSDRHGTATTTTLLDEHRNRLSFYHPGPLHDLLFTDLPPALFTAATTLLITGYSLLPGLRPSGYRAALSLARQQGARTALDIGPAIGTPVLLDELRPLLPDLDYLLTNDYELSVCTTLPEIEAAARTLLAAGANAVLVKQGGTGATLYRPSSPALFVPGFPVEAQVTIGAGDTFNASFLFALREGMTEAEAICFANAAAALVVSGGKSVLGAKTRTEVEAFLAAHV